MLVHSPTKKIVNDYSSDFVKVRVNHDDQDPFLSEVYVAMDDIPVGRKHHLRDIGRKLVEIEGNSTGTATYQRARRACRA